MLSVYLKFQIKSKQPC